VRLTGVRGEVRAEDDGLVERLRKDDATAQSEFVRRYQEMVFRVCHRMLRNRDDALDCSQEAFVKALRGIGGFREGSSLSSWLYRIAVNEAISAARKRRVREFISLEDEAEPAGTENPAYDAERSRLSSDISRAVAKLPPKQRAVFVLRHYEGLSVAETAEAVGRSEGAVKANFHLAMTALGKKLAKMGYGPDSI
jgi:RNA polymerase sigma-70 factor (ECF subfamily)